MNTTSHFTPETPFVLAQGKLMRVAPAGLRAGSPWLLRVEAGAVWLTWPGCIDDHFLVAGQQAEVPAGVQALVEVEPRLIAGAAMLRVSLVRRPARPERTLRWPWPARATTPSQARTRLA